MKLMWVSILCVALALSRWALLPAYLITFDEINFALAIDEFNPAKHQPQPPGYPVFVALLKIVAVLIGKIEYVFLAAALLLSAAALGLLWRLCELAAGPRYGVLGPLLLLFNPAFWLAALTNPVRLCYAVGATAVALCVWLACRRPSALWIPLAAAALGLSAGARPTLALLMAPLVFWGAFQRGLRWKEAGLSVLCFCIAVCAWLPSLLGAVGGWRPWLEILRGYSGTQFAETSLLFGATPGNALQMAWQAVVWSCLGALSWVWAVPFAASKLRENMHGFTLSFLAMWFFPGLLFHAVVHAGDPDHMLSIVPATCVAGALVLRSFTQDASAARGRLTIFFCVLLNILFFVKPISKTAKLSTYKPVDWMDGYIADVIGGVGGARSRGPVTAVFHESSPGWRHLYYYYPDVDVIVISPAATDRLPIVRHIYERRERVENDGAGVVTLPGCGTIVWIDLQSAPVPTPSIPMRAVNSRVFFTQSVPGESYLFRGLRFQSVR